MHKYFWSIYISGGGRMSRNKKTGTETNFILKLQPWKYLLEHMQPSSRSCVYIYIVKRG